MRPDCRADAAPRYFVGEAVEVASERSVLAALDELLSRLTSWSVVFANFHAIDRQVDLVVGSDLGTVLIEVKTYGGVVEGEVNGDWRITLGDVRTEPTGNAYNQALTAKNRLKDALSLALGRATDYPGAAVIVVPRIVTGSKLPSDFKVRTYGLEDLASVLAPNKLRLTLEDWLAAAGALRLTEVASVEAATSPAIQEAQSVIGRYTDELLRFHSPHADVLLPDWFELGGRSASTDEVVEIVLSTPGAYLLKGPSGCGKSLLGSRVVCESVRRGYVPMVVQARYFKGDFVKELDRELALMAGPATGELLRAARRLQRPVLLVVDGYNECSAAERLFLTRCLRAASRRLGSTCLISSQVDLERSDLLGPQLVAVKSPSAELKRAIAAAAAASADVGTFDVLLATTSSGLEARLVGEVGSELPSGSGIRALFEVYARKRLHEHAVDGMTLLAELAGHLVEMASFSTTRANLERLAFKRGMTSGVLRTLDRSGLIAEQGTRVSFGHERFFHAFAGEWFFRTSDGKADEVLAAMAQPRMHRSRAFVLASIEDERVISHVLAGIADVELLNEIHAGACGTSFKRALEIALDRLQAKLVEEARGVRFDMDPHGELSAVEESTVALSTSEQAQLNLLAALHIRGLRLRKSLDACLLLDAAMERDAFRLGSAPSRSRQFCALDELRLKCYGMGRETSLTQLLSHVRGGGPNINASAAVIGPAAHLVLREWGDELTEGQLILLAHAGRFHFGSRGVYKAKVLAFLQNGWSSSSSFVKAAVLDLMPISEPLSDAERDELVEALMSLDYQNVFIGSAITMALQQIGGLRSEEQREIEKIEAELADILSNPEDSTAWSCAEQFITRTYDHPLREAYGQVVRTLDEASYAVLNAMALLAMDRHTQFRCTMIQAVGKAAATGSALRALRPFLELPLAGNSSPQDAIQTFLCAHEVWGGFEAELPEMEPLDELQPEEERSMQLAGRLVYLGAMEGKRPGTQRDELQGLYQAFGELDGSQVMATMAEVFYASVFCSRNESYPALAPELFLTAARECLASMKKPRHFVARFEERECVHLRRACDVLLRYGDESDTGLLRTFVDHPNVGHAALMALQAVEDRGLRI